MKKQLHLSLVALLLLGTTLFAQNKPLTAQEKALTKIARFDQNSNWLTFNNNVSVNASQLFENYKSEFSLGADDKMNLSSVSTDKLGQKHYKYQQYYKGLPIFGSVVAVHEENNRVKTMNGFIIKGLNKSSSPILSEKEAINNALVIVAATKYKWEDAKAEQMLKSAKNDNNATYYPKAKLVWYSRNTKANASSFKLAYQVEVYAINPLSKQMFFIDALNGQVINKINTLKNVDVPGVATTKYNGVQTIRVDSISPNSFRLRETTHGNGIETYSLNNGMDNTAAVDITNTTNNWTVDQVANGAHWAAAVSYNYYNQVHSRNSYDDLGSKIINYVHYGTNTQNAFWDGSSLTFGDGGGSYTAFTSLDICGHEFTHGVTEHTANLIYQDESGALNEAMSDIFATCIEFFGDATPNYTMGEDIGPAFRSMVDPKANQQPTTYLGEYWQTDSTTDNGGVHQNNSVGNYWFYLLAVGDTGVNDNNVSYQIQGIGMNKAERIVYRMLSVYLTESSQYMDAYQASLEAAKDLYGECSIEYKAVAEAWYAVGVGYPRSNNKIYVLDVISPTTACGIGFASIEIKLLFNGCDTTLLVGTKIPLAYKADNGSLLLDTLTLSSPWIGGDSLNFTFHTPVDFSALGVHTINVYSKMSSSLNQYNDSIIGYKFNNLLQQNIDMKMVELLSPQSGCGLTNAETVVVKFKFLGCDSLASGSVIDLGYKLNAGSAVVEPYTLIQNMYPNDEILYSFNTKGNFSTLSNTISVWTEFDVDTINGNDTLKNIQIKVPSILNQSIGFQNASDTDYYMVNTDKYGKVVLATQAANGSGKGLKMTSGNAFNYFNELQMPQAGMDMWSVNEMLSAKVSFCIDATSWNTANLKFDLKQTHGGTLYSQYLGAGDYTMASNFRVLVNNNQIGGTYNPTTNGSDPYLTHYVNLDSYAGTKFTLTFETRNISSDTTIFVPFILDNAYLDNVFVSINSAVEENASKMKANVYPNPSDGNFTLNLEMLNADGVTIDVFDIVGSKVNSINKNVNSGMNNIPLNLNSLTNGIYILKIYDTNNNSSIIRVVKH
ncbi:MAG: M4 family metallopeptidase [Bacteroidota bacterium]